MWLFLVIMTASKVTVHTGDPNLWIPTQFQNNVQKDAEILQTLGYAEKRGAEEEKGKDESMQQAP